MPKKDVNHVGLALEALKTSLKAVYHLEDDLFVEVVLSAYAGLHLDADPLWLYLVSPPSYGKSELLMLLQSLPTTFMASDLTDKSLISGYQEEDTKKQKKDCSWLPKMNGKVVVTKDFTIILNKRYDVRDRIFAQLRDVYDGTTTSLYGNDDVSKTYRCTFNYLAGVTPIIEKHWSVSSKLGERFLMYRLRLKDEFAHARASMHNKDRRGNRERLQAEVAAFVGLLPQATPSISTGWQERICKLASVLAVGRTSVQRDERGNVLYVDQPEGITRIVNQLCRLGMSLCIVRGRAALGKEEFSALCRIAYDSLPVNRRLMLRVLWRQSEFSQPATVFTQALEGRMSHSTIGRLLEELGYLGMVSKESGKPLSEKKSNKNGEEQVITVTPNYYRLSATFRARLVECSCHL